MKMENEITSHKNGTVTLIHINPGANVQKGTLLMEISD
jgi:biotin carboxyl carrier protein